MTQATPTIAADAHPTSREQVSAWILAHLEEKRPETQGTLHDDMSFDSIGLDSLTRVDMITALETRFGIALDPTLAYDFVTPGALSAFIWGEISGVPVDPKQLMDI